MRCGASELGASDWCRPVRELVEDVEGRIVPVHRGCSVNATLVTSLGIVVIGDIKKNTHVVGEVPRSVYSHEIDPMINDVTTKRKGDIVNPVCSSGIVESG